MMSSLRPSAVTSSTGIVRSGSPSGLVRSASSNWKPFITGMLTSLSTKCTGSPDSADSSSCRSAALPSSASRIFLKPSSRSSPEMIRRMVEKSSTTRKQNSSRLIVVTI